MKKKIFWLILGIIVAIIALAGTVYSDIIEYTEIGYLSAYITDMSARAAVFVSVFILMEASLFINYGIIRKNLIKKDGIYAFESKKTMLKVITILAGVVSAALIGNVNYETVLLFFNKTPFGSVDPIFGQDISFYIFSLPFYKLVVSFLSTAFVAGVLYTAAVYFVFAFGFNVKNFFEMGTETVHVVANILLFALVKSLSLYLGGFEILYKSFSSGTSGAGITDVLVWKPFYTVGPIVLFVSVLMAIIFLKKRYKKPFIISVVAFPLVYALFLIAATLFQSLYVGPREVTAEKPYIEYNMEATKKAYGIDDIEERVFNITYDLTAEDIKNNSSTIENVRITDNNANLTVANTLQATRGYYSFTDMDILPYEINGKIRGISTAVREIDPERLDAASRSYINTRLRYTHGYGAVMSYINTVTSEGQPEYIVKDVPLKTSEGAPLIKVPQVYYGELTDDYAVVGTDYLELDYMEDGKSVETRYEGKGGIKLTPINRAYYAAAKGDFMLLFSGYINSDSKLLLNRNIIERARKIAPYLVYDNDPYMIVDDEGRLKWVIDAYTVTDMYPYSQSYLGINYIRNSAKVVIDAYDGTTDFYIQDKNDPLIMAYAGIYPEVFSHEELPSDIASHIRYPEFIFKIQMEMYEEYHVDDAGTFYSKSDLWLTAREKYNNSEEKDVEPYYNVMNLTSDKEDMVLMLPFIPNAKQNLIAWVGASSNYDTYGDMIVYLLPEGSPVNGTLQIENMISSDPYISQQISLWDQGDSQVMKGNLMVIPIENSVIYIEPLYISSGATSSIPQVKRIIVAYGDKVAMAESLDQAFTQLFGKYEGNEETEDMPFTEAGLEEIRTIFNEVKTAMEQGDFEIFGKKMQELETAIGR